ncbi:MAG: CotS family spore coat protein [Carboxydocellales bacterium]
MDRVEELKSKTIEPLLAHWGLKPLTVKKVRDVYQIQTGEGVFCFKEVPEKAEKLLFISQVFRHLEAKGFGRLAAFRPTLLGDYYILENGNYYIVTPWLEGTEPDYHDQQQIGATAKTLAEFHLASQDFVPQGNAQVKIKIGKWNKKLKSQLIELIDFCTRAESSSETGGFDKIMRVHGSWLGQQALSACQLLGSSPYDQLVRQYDGKVPICHGDTAARNFLIDGQQQAWMIDFDSMAVDLPIVDLWRLLRRTLRKSEWRMEKADNILEQYSQVRLLSKQEFQVLHALLHFPERPWRLAKRYYAGSIPVEERVKIQQRVEEYLLLWENKNYFLEQFAEKYVL